MLPQISGFPKTESRDSPCLSASPGWTYPRFGSSAVILWQSRGTAYSLGFGLSRNETVNDPDKKSQQTPAAQSARAIGCSGSAGPVWGFAAGAVALLALSYSVFMLSDATILSLGQEDGLFEYATAICFGVAGVLLLVRFASSRAGNDLFLFRTRRNVFLLLLGLVFVLGCGEEISWGQRLVGYETPDSIAQVNLQGETNIHNLTIFHRRDSLGQEKSGWMLWLSVERLFSLFWLVYCFVIPIVNHAIEPIRRLLSRVNLPIVPFWIGVFFPLNYVIAKFIELGLGGETSSLHWPLLEIKESCFAALFLLTAVYFLRPTTGKREAKRVLLATP